jgi:hypothetical protein
VWRGSEKKASETTKNTYREKWKYNIVAKAYLLAY